MAEGVIVADADGKMLDWNRAALAMHGYTSMEEFGQSLADIADIFQLTTLAGSRSHSTTGPCHD